MNKIIKVSLSVLFVASLILAAGCSSSDNTENATDSESNKGKPITITFMPSQSSYTNFWSAPIIKNKIFPDFEKKENVKIDVQVAPDTTNELVKIKLATGEAPELWAQNLPQMAFTFNCPENCEVLDNQPWVKRLVNPNLIKYQPDGHIYGLPIEAATFYGGVYYNKKLLESMGIVNPKPKTYNEFLDLLETIKQKGNGVIPIYMTDKDAWTTQIFTTLGLGVVMHGQSDVWDKLTTNKMKFSDVPEFTKLLYDFLKIYEKGYVNKDHMSQPYDSTYDTLSSGKAAMIIQGEWAAKDFHTKNPNLELGSFIIPFADKDIMATGTYVGGVYVGKKSKNKDLALKFLDYMSQPEVMNQIFAERGGFPPFKDVDGGKVIPAIKNLYDNYIVTGKNTSEFDAHFDVARAILDGGLFRIFQEMVSFQKKPEQVWKEWDVMYSQFMKEKNQPGF
jgi:raffinose/stachyose/melibiose transport system substrate-binding protein